MEGKRYTASQNCSWKWHFHAQGHEWTCRTTPFPSAVCPWASVSSYWQPLYLSSLSLNMSDRTQCFPPQHKGCCWWCSKLLILTTLQNFSANKEFYSFHRVEGPQKNKEESQFPYNCGRNGECRLWKAKWQPKAILTIVMQIIRQPGFLLQAPSNTHRHHFLIRNYPKCSTCPHMHWSTCESPHSSPGYDNTQTSAQFQHGDTQWKVLLWWAREGFGGVEVPYQGSAGWPMKMRFVPTFCVHAGPERNFLFKEATVTSMP